MFFNSQAIDRDEHNTKNSQIRYEIISGNYDKKFGIDEINGKISVIEPLGLFTGLDYDVSSNGDYIDADIRRTSKLHSSGKKIFLFQGVYKSYIHQYVIHFFDM